MERILDCKKIKFKVDILLGLHTRLCDFLRVKKYKIGGLKIGEYSRFSQGARVVGIRNVTIGRGFFLGNNSKLKSMTTAEGPIIVIGNNVFINDNVLLDGNIGITIGDDTLIGPGVIIIDSNHGVNHGPQLIRDQKSILKKIEIGKNVWIGANCVILPGVKIYDGAVVGANSTVTKDIPANAIAYGSPAIARKMRGEKI